jgi:V/A-type H+-transporting ATPase subunit F
VKYCVIGDEDTVLGFGMVGVEGTVVEGATEAEGAFRAAIEAKDVAIVIITERTAQMIRGVLDPYVGSRRFPLVVEVPDRRGPLPGRSGVREMVTAAIGIKL